jgi:tetratricopeptide (TPR) repeat protein
MRIKPYLLTIIISLTFCFNLNAQQIKNEDDNFIEGIKLYTLEEYENAAELLQLATSQSPNNDAAAFYLGLTYLNMEDKERGELYIKKALEIDPGNYWYRIRLAQLYYDTNRLELSLSLYEKLKKDFPKKSSIYYEIIDLYTNNGQIDKALETLTQIESIGGVNSATLNARFELLRMQGNYEEAFKYLLQLEKMVDSPQISYMVGDYYKTKYQDEEAISFYNKSLSMEPNYSPSYFGLAEVYRTQRNMPLFFKNINIFFLSKDINPIMKTQYMKEVIFNPNFVQTFPFQVDTMVQNILHVHPKDSSTISMAGEYYIKSGQEAIATSFYQLNTKLYPDNLSFEMTYLSLLYYLQQWGKVVEEGSEALNRFPNEPSIYEIISIAQWQQNKIDEAIAGYEQLSKIAPKNSKYQLSAYAALGDIYHLKNNLRKAFSYYDKALKIDPKYVPVLNNYAYYLSILNKKLSKALEMSKITIVEEPDNPTYLDTYAWILYLTGNYKEAKVHFKHAMLYGGKESAVIMDHYADVLYKLNEYDLAFIYWEQANKLDPSLMINEKIEKYKSAQKK